MSEAALTRTAIPNNRPSVKIGIRRGSRRTMANVRRFLRLASLFSAAFLNRFSETRIDRAAALKSFVRLKTRKALSSLTSLMPSRRLRGIDRCFRPRGSGFGDLFVLGIRNFLVRLAIFRAPLKEADS